MNLTPEQRALRDAAQQAIEDWRGKSLPERMRVTAQFHAEATPTVILALLAQLEAQEAPSPMDNLRKNDPAFAAHLDRCSAEVATWPKWKLMGDRGAAQEAPPEPATITLNFERPRMWHMGCKVSHLGGNVCKTVSHDQADSLVECRACGKRGRYPAGAVGERVVAEESAQTDPSQ